MHLIRFILPALIVWLPSNAWTEETKLRVGFIAPFSGSAKAYGDATRNGFELARSESQDKSIHVTYEDDEFIPSKTISAFRKLTQTETLDVIVCIGSTTCNAIAPLAEAQRLPLIGFASDPQVSKNRQYVIRSFPSGQEEGRRTGQEVLKRNFAKIGILTGIHDYPLSWRSGLLSAVPPGDLLLDEQVPPDLLDFKSLLLKARQKGVESFVTCLLPGQSGIFAKQSREIGMKSKIGGCLFLEDENEAKLANGALTGAWYISVGISPDFAQKYRQKYGNTNTLASAAVHYDLFNILALLVRQDQLTDISKHIMALGPREAAAGPLSMRSENSDQFFNYNLVAKEIPAG